MHTHQHVCIDVYVYDICIDSGKGVVKNVKSRNTNWSVSGTKGV